MENNNSYEMVDKLCIIDLKKKSFKWLFMMKFKWCDRMVTLAPLGVFSLKDAVDYLEQLIDDEETAFENQIEAIYIEPPEDDGEVSGEDDANECEGGTFDDLTRNQLKAGCELVLRNGQHVNNDASDSNNNEEQIIIDVLNEAESFQTPLRKVKPTPCTLALPPSNKECIFTWSNDGQSNSMPIFPEPNYDDCRDLEPHELFERFFDNELLNHIIYCSARYATKNISKPVKPISIPELRTFIGILLVTGYNSVPSYKMYWNGSDDLRNELIVLSMRRSRFEEILRCLHFEPDLVQDRDNTDKLWKLRPITDHLKSNMIKNFHPTQNLAFDESMIAYYGRHGCKQFIKGKPIRFGYKVWSLCTPSGYLINFEIYQGKNPRSHGPYEDRFGKCAAPLLSMIDDFSENVQALPFSFYFDNLFTGYPLLVYLKSRGYNGTGTIRENRIPSSCPLDHKNQIKKLPRGTYKTIKMDETGIKLTKWVDNSVVCMASTCFGALPTSTASRYSKEAGKRLNVVRPCAISEYNKYMCGVDRLDQNVNNHRIAYRGKKWWSSIFTWLIDVSINNAWQLQQGPKELTQFEFKRAISMFYCNHYGERPTQPGPKRPRSENDIFKNIRFDRIDHFVGPLEKRRRCAAENCKSVIKTRCIKCDIGLCVNCFAVYHTK